MIAAAELASLAPATLRPDVRISGPRYRGERTVQLIHDPRTGRVYEFGPREAFLTERLAAQTTPEQISRAYAERFARPLAPASWGQYLGLLDARSLLAGDAESTATAREPVPARRSQLRAGRWVIASVSNAVPRAYRMVRWSFSPWFVIPALAVIATMLTWLTIRVIDQPGLVTHAQDASVLLVLVPACWLSLTLHEFGHGVAAVHFGGEATEMGVLVRPPTVFLYCRVNGSGYITSRRAQVLVALAGVWVNLLTAVPLWVWWVLDTDPAHREVLLAALVMITLTGLVNLVPAAPADGFKALAAALGHLDLARDARVCLADTLRGLAGRGTRAYGIRLRVVYVAVAVLNLAIYLWLAGAVIWLCLERLPQPAGALALAALLAYALTMSVVHLTSPSSTSSTTKGQS